MEFVDVVRGRRMVRRFDPARPVPRTLVETVLKLAIRSPSAGHTQGWLFLVLDDITTTDKYWAATTDGATNAWLAGMRTAPVLVVCYCDRNAYLDRYAAPDKGWDDRDPNRWPIPYWHVDTGMAAMTLLLAARDHGLGACFFGVPGPRWSAVASAFGVATGLEPVGVVALGYPAGDEQSRPMRRGRKPFGEVVRFAADTQPDRPPLR